VGLPLRNIDGVIAALGGGGLLVPASRLEDEPRRKRLSTGLAMLWVAALLTLWTGYDYLKAAVRTAIEN